MISGLWPVAWICIFHYVIIQLYSVIWILPFGQLQYIKSRNSVHVQYASSNISLKQIRILCLCSETEGEQLVTSVEGHVRTCPVYLELKCGVLLFNFHPEGKMRLDYLLGGY